MVMHVTLLWTLSTPHTMLTVGSDHGSTDLVSNWKSQISSFKIIESESNAKKKTRDQNEEFGFL